MPKPLARLTTGQAEERSGIPRRTIIDAINRGDLRAAKLPGATGSWLILPSDLDRWAAKRASARDALSAAQLRSAP